MCKGGTLRLILSYAPANSVTTELIPYKLDARGDFIREDWQDIRTRWKDRALGFWGDNAEWVNRADIIFGGYWRDKRTGETLTLE